MGHTGLQSWVNTNNKHHSLKVNTCWASAQPTHLTAAASPQLLNRNNCVLSPPAAAPAPSWESLDRSPALHTSVSEPGSPPGRPDRTRQPWSSPGSPRPVPASASPRRLGTDPPIPRILHRRPSPLCLCLCPVGVRHPQTPEESRRGGEAGGGWDTEYPPPLPRPDQAGNGNNLKYYKRTFTFASRE